MKGKFLFNAITCEVKEVPSSVLMNKLKKHEFVFERREEITLEVRKRLINQVRLDDEVWYRLPCVKDFKVSTYGRVKRRFASGKEKILCKFERKKIGKGLNSIFVKIDLGTGYKEVQVTKLMGMVMPIKGKGDRIIHVDRNIYNNHVTNLKRQYPKDMIKIATRKTMCPVIKLDLDTREELDSYESIREAARCNFISHESIRLCTLGRQKTAGGFGWVKDKVL